MDFFEHQEAARRWTKTLILYLVLGLIATAVAACVAAGVDAVRVHDVHVMRQLVIVAEALGSPRGGAS